MLRESRNQKILFPQILSLEETGRCTPPNRKLNREKTQLLLSMAGPNKHSVGVKCGPKNSTGITHFTLKGTLCNATTWYLYGLGQFILTSWNLSLFLDKRRIIRSYLHGEFIKQNK